MKKTLLIAAAALAASVISSQAQVYSQNIVGYYNITTPAGGFNLIANQLVNGDDASKTNNGINACLASGFVSDPNGVNNSLLYYWTGAGYGIYQYFTGADADFNFLLSGSVSGWYDSGGTLQTLSLKQGGGSFIKNVGGVPMTNTFVGTVRQGTNVLIITSGFNIYSIAQPISTNLESSPTFANFPGTSDPNGVNNDLLYKWNGAGFAIYAYYTGADADFNFLLSGSVNGFYDSGGTLKKSAPNVGESFFIKHTGVPVTWTGSFTAP